jgi:hypothetical protein
MVNVNMPLDMFVKDANEKNSKDCLFTQTADLIAFSALMKARQEQGLLAADQHALQAHTLYDSIPKKILNTKATFIAPRDGIVRLR